MTQKLHVGNIKSDGCHCRGFPIHLFEQSITLMSDRQLLPEAANVRQTVASRSGAHSDNSLNSEHTHRQRYSTEE